MSTPVMKVGNAERDSEGNEFLSSEPWTKMGTRTYSSRASEYMDSLARKVTGDLDGEDHIRVAWLSGTLFFVVGGYWLLRSLKDPIMSVINGVEYIPQAKIASLFVVFGLVIVYNKLLDIFPKHQLFYMMGIAYGVMFTFMGLMLMHPTLGLPNTQADPSRLLGWVSYVTIESFGSMVVQCYWALVNSSVDVTFAKKNFGLIVAGAQIGSILGPSLATQAGVIGIPALYLFGAIIMFLMVGMMFFYVERFGPPGDDSERNREKEIVRGEHEIKKSKNEEGILEGFYLMYRHQYVQGIFFISSLFMVQVTIIDYMMKILAKERYSVLYPNDPQAALRGFASFMGYFGQTTNTISFLFSLFGTGTVIRNFGLTATLIAFPVLMLVCTALVWVSPNIWMVFFVMMVIKGMSYALNNPTKEILYQMTSTNIKFKCKSWIDTFGQRSNKAAGSLITNQFANSMVDLVNYGSLVGVITATFLIWVSHYMGREFDELSASGQKIGEYSRELTSMQAANQNNVADTSCYEEEDDDEEIEEEKKDGGEKTVLLDHIPEVSDADRCV